MDGLLGFLTLLAIFYFVILPIIIFSTSAKAGHLSRQLADLEEQVKKLSENKHLGEENVNNALADETPFPFSQLSDRERCHIEEKPSIIAILSKKIPTMETPANDISNKEHSIEKILPDPEPNTTASAEVNATKTLTTDAEKISSIDSASSFASESIKNPESESLEETHSPYSYHKTETASLHTEATTTSSDETDENKHVDDQKYQYRQKYRSTYKPSNGWDDHAQHDKRSLEPSHFGLLLKKAFYWFIKDNPLAKMGILILFFGIAYLVKYSIENTIVPIEIRLFSAVVISLGLLGVGWWVRKKNKTFSLILQGGSIGSLYIITLGSFKYFELIPASICFALLCIICACCITLALIQNARTLAILALFGGYAAPILTSTGSGNYIALFSFYLVLSVVAAVLSYKKIWRELIYTGFICTSATAFLWGENSYIDADYIPCQIFIIANLAIFGFIYPLLISKRISVDYILLLSAPCIAFTLQYSIVTKEFSSAISALVLSAIYLGLIFYSVRAANSAIVANWEKFVKLCLLILGISFLSLAIPLALSAQWTAFFWALEGLIILHIGLTQKERFFQIGAFLLLAISIVSSLYAVTNNTLTLLSYVISMSIVSLCWLTAAYDWRRFAQEQVLQATYLTIERILLGVALVFWCFTLFNLKTYLHDISHNDYFTLVFALILGSIYIWGIIGYQLKWQVLRYTTLLLWPILLCAIYYQLLHFGTAFTLDWHNLIWLPAFIMPWAFLRFNKNEILTFILEKALHLSLYWITAGFILLNIITINLLNENLYSYYDSFIIKTLMTILFCAVTVLATFFAASRDKWPVSFDKKLYTFTASLPFIVILCMASFISMNFSGNDITHIISVIPYVPVLNGLDITIALALLTLIHWLQVQKQNVTLFISNHKIIVLFLIVVAAFINCTAIRGVAYYGDIAWDIDSLLASDLVQFSLTLIWILFALAIMLWSNKYQHRQAWLLGIAIIAAVVIKLFLIDSAQTGGIIRAIIFIAVAIFILVISYFAPMPPKKIDSHKNDSEHNKENIHESHS